MNIALFTETYLPYINGVVTHVKSLKDGLERAGHKVLIVTAGSKTKRHYVDEINNILWCPAREFKRFYNYGLALPVSAKRRRLIQAFQPDIIHIHTEFCLGFSGLQIAKILKVPLVYTMHTMYDDYLYYVAPKPLIPMVKVMSHRYFRYFGKRAGAITGPSQKVQHYLSDCGVVKEVNVVPNPVELDKFQPSCIDQKKVAAIKEAYHIKSDELVVCFCGRLGREKSVDVLLTYIAQTLQRTDKIRFMIFGDGPCREELVKQTKQLGLDDVVCFAGKIPHDELVNYYACCQLYITTSLSDTNSISMLEAMASGLPVLHRYDALNEGQIENGINGFIFFTAQDMYKCLLEYKHYPPEKKLAVKHSVIDSVKKSGQENLAKYLLTLYEHLTHEQKHDSDDRWNNRKIAVYEMKLFRQKK